MTRKTLAQLRAEKTKGLPTRSHTVYLDLEALADVQRLREERLEIAASSPAMQSTDEGEEEQTSRPRKMADKVPPRVAEIDAELEELYARMRESEATLLLRALPGGEWLRWKDAHPAREDNETDAELAWGRCNAVDLIDELGRFVAELNGEAVTEADWEDWLADTIAPADLREMIPRVVEMNEAVVSVPKEPSSSLRTPKRGSGSRSPAASASPKSGSSAGSRPKPTSTTTPTGT